MPESAPKPKEPELRGPLHLVRCFGQLAVLYAQELAYRVNEAIEAAIPDDDELDAAIPSSIGVRQEHVA